MSRDRRIWLAAGLAVAGPMLLVFPVPGDAPPARAPLPPITVAAVEPLRALYARPLFAPDRSVGSDRLPGDAPRLVGIVGRIGRDAVALVERAQGGARTIAPGEAADGWTLVSLTVDAALFTRGGKRIRVPLPAGDDADADADENPPADQ